MDRGQLYFDPFSALPAPVCGGNGDRHHGRYHGTGRGMYEYGN